MSRKLKTLHVGTGSSAILGKNILCVGLCGKHDNMQFVWEKTLMYSLTSTITDRDMRVFYCIIKAFTDNQHDNIKNKLSKLKASEKEGDTLKSIIFKVDAKEISKLAFKGRSRPKWIEEALAKIVGISIQTLNVDGVPSRGKASVLNGVEISGDGKGIIVSFNRNMLIHFSQAYIQYNFHKMLSLSGLGQRLFMAMQNYKYFISKNKYGYTYIPDFELRELMNHDNANTKRVFEKLFKEMGVNFVLGRDGKWFYPEAKIAK